MSKQENFKTLDKREERDLYASNNTWDLEIYGNPIFPERSSKYKRS